MSMISQRLCVVWLAVRAEVPKVGLLKSFQEIKTRYKNVSILKFNCTKKVEIKSNISTDVLPVDAFVVSLFC